MTIISCSQIDYNISFRLKGSTTKTKQNKKRNEKKNHKIARHVNLNVDSTCFFPYSLWLLTTTKRHRVFLNRFRSKKCAPLECDWGAAICGCCSEFLINSFHYFPQTRNQKPKCEMIENVLRANLFFSNTKWQFIMILLLFIHRFKNISK